MLQTIRTKYVLCGIVCLSLSVVGTRAASAKEFDVSESSAAEKIEKCFGSITPGNEGSADIEQLVLDTSSLEVRSRISVTAAHSWGSVNVPAATPPFHRKVEIAADKTVKAGFRFNLERNRVSGDVSLGRIGLGVTVVAGKHYSKDFEEIRVDLEREVPLSSDKAIVTQNGASRGTIRGNWSR